MRPDGVEFSFLPLLHGKSTHMHLGGGLQRLSGERQVSTLAQVVVVHALGDLGDGIVP